MGWFRSHRTDIFSYNSIKPKVYVFSCVHSTVAPHTDCEIEQWVSASISSTRTSQRAQKHVQTCSSGVMAHLLTCAGKPTAAWISPRGEPNRANVTAAPSRPANPCYVTLLHCGRMLKSGRGLDKCLPTLNLV